MSNVLFLSVPSHGHVNPTLGLVSELVKRGENVTYFSSLEFKERIEAAGASFKCYAEDLDMFKAPQQDATAEQPSPIARIIRSGSVIIENILAQTKGQSFDYLVHSTPFLFTKPIAQLLKVPTVASLAVFAGLDAFMGKSQPPGGGMFSKAKGLKEALDQTAQELEDRYAVSLPQNVLELLFNKGDINLVYTSSYFAADLTYFDDTYKFVGPPVHDRKEQSDFPFELLSGKKVMYISLGTVFGSHSPKLYAIFFNSFAAWDGMVVMAAYGVDHAKLAVPDNFIVRNYVPQSELLKYTSVAITHCGMNSMSDLLTQKIPFVSLPLGADQPALAARAQQLGATIVLDVKTLEPEELKKAVDAVMSEPGYLDSIKKIADSFASAGGYPKAVDEIFKLKRDRNIDN
jgi:MGT family glycosyltransferase